ncbi:Lrp/AsnC family transcriptional regulator [Liquorilactobacillus satsumensis]|uniref:HTH asnC-type domain-containing protein n=2 Tax=Liquorilactobacillus satsumensis TaxID=259059 RepID=A0A0R1UW57_9LACO|nr:AsnC family transcriptional regulator [Liquorilactobacillus satsumensis]KRL97246.1 hypothetical protein FD50_GL001804 [Liquorilactobacillus satsumensis DSM 16230 = JCM 12392]MCP9328672.1 AsnC family transcriptional regulator [Liquorilactobacillus satsumensis]
MDKIDRQILTILSQNSKLTNKEIGAIIHLTGQAVGNRIAHLQQNGTIQRFKIEIKYSQTQFIRVFMDSNKYKDFEHFANAYQEVTAVYKVSGQACYLLVSHFAGNTLAEFIEALSKWARYSVETVIADKTVPVKIDDSFTN